MVLACGCGGILEALAGGIGVVVFSLTAVLAWVRTQIGGQR